MDRYTVLRLRSPSATPPFYQPGLFFNSTEHVRQQSQHSSCTITALNQTTQLAEARCTFFADGVSAVSPIAAPFGSVEFAPTLPDTVLTKVIEALIDEARSTGCRTIRLVNYPHCYAPEQAERLTEHLTQQGFAVTQNNVNFHIPVADEPFDANLSTAERRRLQKCRRSGFQFEHWPNPDPAIVLLLLAAMRSQRQYPLTLGFAHLADLLCRFDDEFNVFVVKDGLTVAALTITVRVRADILYNFLPASRPDYGTFSPMVMLTDGLFTYCRQQGIRLLDLGVSLDSHRQPKLSLMRFKQNLGARASPKLIFEKQL